MKNELKIELHIYVHNVGHNNAWQGHEATPDMTATGCCKKKMTAVEVKENLQQTLDDLSLRRRHKTMLNYMTALRSFEKFLGETHTTDALDAGVMESYERWLREHGLSLNTVSCYMRSLRSVLHTVDKEATQMFRNVFTGNTKTEKRAVSEQIIIRLKALRLPGDSYLALARDVFLFCFYAQGMPFVDAAHLRYSQISNQQIVYDRHKTGQRVVVHLEPCMKQIIQRYGGRQSDFVFPIMDATATDLSCGSYLKALNRYNQGLKKLAAKAGITQHLTSYVARHSWASSAYRMNVDLPVISKALGHSNPQTTLIYLKEIDDSRLAEANHRLLERFV